MYLHRPAGDEGKRGEHRDTRTKHKIWESCKLVIVSVVVPYAYNRSEKREWTRHSRSSASCPPAAGSYGQATYDSIIDV